jgi:antitoxin (DNA-binding transcriptional repressor) of toxin-antitoxin stability system
VTITRDGRPVARLISNKRLGAMLETMELLADPDFLREWRKERAGKQRYVSVDALVD